MKLLVFSVYDAKAEAFMRPFFAPTRGLAIRSFRDGVNAGGEEPLAKHPEDYTLYEVGSFDEGSGELVSLEPRFSLGLASTFKEQIS